MRRTVRAASLLCLLLLVVGASPASAFYDGALQESSCLARKVRCVLTKKKCHLACERKALAKGIAVDPTCLARCRDKFLAAPPTGRGCFEKVEQLPGCDDVGDGALFEAKVEAHLKELLHRLVPTVPAAGNRCAADKLQCISKYDACILKRYASAWVHGTPVGDLSKCAAIMAFGPDGCFGRLEAKHCQPPPPYELFCPAPNTCLTIEDETETRKIDDAFLDDVVASLETGSVDLESQRCSGDTSVVCASAPGGGVGCGGALGTCEFFFGSYLPLSAGGVSVCVANQWSGVVSGTFDRATGVGAGTAPLRRTTYGGISIDGPCPRCVGDAFPNDGTSAGACAGGSRDGLACDASGATAEPEFGATSLDCPPSTAVLSTATVVLAHGNDGPVVATVGAASPTCNGAPGKRCLCASCSLDSSVACMSNADCAAASAGTCTNAAGAPRNFNTCWDDCSTIPDGTLCLDVGGGEGECPDRGPFDYGHCRQASFLSCVSNFDCAAIPGDSCQQDDRPCFVGYHGAVGDSVTAFGSHAAPRNGNTVATLASVFCLPPTASPAVNVVFGLPGPARLQLLGIGAENGSAAACPTRASFVPTIGGDALDLGWTGIGHDSRVVGASKVTVGVTGCSASAPGCGVCTYVGPIGN